MTRAELKAKMIWDVTDYNLTETQTEYVDYRYTYKQLKRILGEIETQDWNGRQERAFLGDIAKH